MSATVGYGVELTGSVLGYPLENGDWEDEISGIYPELTVVRSFPEYSHEKERAFVLLTESLVKVGGSAMAATDFNPTPQSTETLDRFIAETNTPATSASWFLVDRYLY